MQNVCAVTKVGTVLGIVKDTLRDIAVLLAKEDCIPKHVISELCVPTCTARENSSSNVVISSVSTFSGLERPIVVLVDLECSLPYGPKQNPFLFSAVTRAMAKLIIIRCQTCSLREHFTLTPLLGKQDVTSKKVKTRS